MNALRHITLLAVKTGAQLALIIFSTTMFVACASDRQNPGAKAASQGNSEEEVVRFSSMTFAGPNVNPANGVSKEEAKVIAEFYRDQFLRGSPVEYHGEDTRSYYFRAGSGDKITVSKNGGRVTRDGAQALNYIGNGLWGWRAGND